MARTNANDSAKTSSSAAAQATDLRDGVDPEDSSEITIYPLRSYLDGKEVRHAGGEGYNSPRHDAVSLIAAGLATDQNPKA